MSALAMALEPSAACAALVRASIEGGIALAVVWLVCRVWRRMPGRARCWLWRVAYVKVLAALVWTTPVRLAWLPARGDAPTVEAMPSRAGAMTTIAMPAGPLVRPLAASGANTSISGAIGAVPLSRSERPFLASVVLAAWCIGAAIVALRLIGHGCAASRLRRRCVVPDDSVLCGRVMELARRLGLRRPPRLLTGAGLPGPLLVGIVRPAIVLPGQLLAGERKTIDLVMAHELAHLRRGDLWWRWLGATVGVLLFFHPLVWLAGREERTAEEMACDELAIGVSRARAADYARALVTVAAHGFGRAPALGAAGVVGSRRVLEQRIIAMQHFSNWSRRRCTLVATFVLMLGLFVIPPWRVVAQEKAASGGSGDAPGTASREEGKGAPKAPAAGGERPMTLEERMRARREQATAATAIDVAAASPHEITITGSISAAILHIRPAGDGLVDQVRVHEGERVKKGDALIQLDARRAQTALARTEAKLALAEAQYSRIQSLVRQAAVSQEEVAQKEAELKVAQADLNVAKQDLGETRVLSPIDGIVGDLSVRAGERVTREQTLVTVVESGALKFHARVASSELGLFVVGQPLVVRVRTDPNRSFQARIARIAPTVDPASATVAIEATLSGETAGLLPGMFATATFTPAPKDGAKQP